MTAPRILSHEAFRREAKEAVAQFTKLGDGPLTDTEVGAVEFVLHILETKLLSQGFLGPATPAEGSVQTSNQGPKEEV